MCLFNSCYWSSKYLRKVIRRTHPKTYSAVPCCAKPAGIFPWERWRCIRLDIYIQGSNSNFDLTTPSPYSCKGSRNVWQQENHPLGTRVAMSFPLLFCIEYTPRWSQNWDHHFWSHTKVSQIHASPFPNAVRKYFPSSAKKRSPIPWTRAHLY